jgi:hypothetical protein
VPARPLRPTRFTTRRPARSPARARAPSDELLGLARRQLGRLGDDHERRAPIVREEGVEVRGDAVDGAGRDDAEDRAGHREERERVAGCRGVHDDEVEASLLRQEELAQLAEEEEVGETGRGAREVAEGRRGEDACRHEPDGGDRPDEVDEEGVELGGDGPEARGELRLRVAVVGVAEERGGVASSVRGNEQDAPPGGGGPRGERGGDRGLADAPLAGDEEEARAGESVERFGRSHRPHSPLDSPPAKRG